MGRLQDEIKKKQPFSSRMEEASLSLARTNDQVMICFERLFREYGLTPSQYNILRILRGDGKPMPVLEVAEQMHTVVPGITGLVDRLEKADLVRRERCLKDRRVIFVCITDAGLNALAKVDRPLRELQERIMGRLSERELGRLITLLEKIRDSLSQNKT